MPQSRPANNELEQIQKIKPNARIIGIAHEFGWDSYHAAIEVIANAPKGSVIGLEMTPSELEDAKSEKPRSLIVAREDAGLEFKALARIALERGHHVIPLDREIAQKVHMNRADELELALPISALLSYARKKGKERFLSTSFARSVIFARKLMEQHEINGTQKEVDIAIVGGAHKGDLDAIFSSQKNHPLAEHLPEEKYNGWVQKARKALLKKFEKGD